MSNACVKQSVLGTFLTILLTKTLEMINKEVKQVYWLHLRAVVDVKYSVKESFEMLHLMYKEIIKSTACSQILQVNYQLHGSR